MVNCVTESLPNWLWCIICVYCVYCGFAREWLTSEKNEMIYAECDNVWIEYSLIWKKTPHLNTRKSFGCVFIFMQFFRFSHLQITVGNVKVDRGRTEGWGNGDVETDNGDRRVTSVFFGKASAKTTVQNVGQTRQGKRWVCGKLKYIEKKIKKNLTILTNSRVVST